MPVNTIRILITLALLACVQLAYGQADVRVRVEVDNPTPASDELVYATVALSNEGSAARTDLVVALRFSSALFFVDVASAGDFREQDFTWHIDQIAPGATDSLRVAVQPNYGGVHTLTAELIGADVPDWDSTPANDRAAEDDQDAACISVPVAVECGQELVLSAPGGRAGYSWYRDGQLLAYATNDTLHPRRSGAYEFVVEGETCASGNCCPVIVERGGCDNDLALLLSVAATDEDDPNLQLTTIRLFNEGDGPVSRVSYYVNGSRVMRLAVGNDGWLLKNGQMKRDWEGLLAPGDSVDISFEMLTLPNGQPSDYVMFAEIEAFYDGDELLTDVDSQPDEDPRNDAIVDDARGAADGSDEDDSDIANLTNCPLVVLEAPAPVCAGEVVTLRPEVTGAAVSYAWSSTAPLSCTTCATPELTVSAATSVTLTTRTDDGCEQTATIEVTTKTCLEALTLRITPYGASELCASLSPSQELNWCAPFAASGVSLDLTQGCLTGASTGAYAGVPDVCLEVCDQGVCTPVDLTVVVTPPLDSLEVSPTAPVCLTDVLQTDGQPIDVQVSDGLDGVRLLPIGAGCFKLAEPGGSYAAQAFEVVHTYAFGGETVRDTTVIAVAARTVCDLEVFAADSVFVEAAAGEATTGPDTEICVLGDAALQQTLSYVLDGEAVASPTTGCEERVFTTFDLSSLPRGYADNGWSVRRYYLDGSTVASNKYFRTLGEMCDWFATFDPEVRASVVDDGRTLRMEGYTRRPSALQVLHYPSRRIAGGYGREARESSGSLLEVPAGLPVGAYELAVTDAQGCSDAAVLVVAPNTSASTQRDSVFVSVEAGDPIAACDLGDLATTDAAWIEVGAGCMMAIASQANTVEYHTFAHESSAGRAERTYVVEVRERTCETLVAEANLSATPDDCRYHDFALGLLRPDLRVSAPAGRTRRLSSPSGSTAGAEYDLSALPALGLAADYRVIGVDGEPRAEGAEGTLADIIATWRGRGVAALADWTTGDLKIVGAGIGEVRLIDVAAGQTVTLSPSAEQVTTYGSYTARRGTSRVSVSSDYCTSALTANVECGVIVVGGGGGVFGFTLGGLPRLDPRDYDLPQDMTSWEIIGEPSAMTARKSADGDYVELGAEVAGSDELTLRGCNDAGECRDVVVALTAKQATCAFDIWQPEEARVLTDRHTGVAEVTLPADFRLGEQRVFVDGAEVSPQMREVATVYAYDRSALAAYAQLASPFGKTADVTADVNGDLQRVLAQAEVTDSEQRITASTGLAAPMVYGQRVSGVWEPVERRVVASEQRAVLSVEAGEHVIVIESADGGCRDEVALAAIWPEVRKRSAVVEINTGETQQYCLPEATGAVVSVRDACVDRSGERVAVELVGDCLELSAYEQGEETVCLVRTYLDGSVDSVTIELSVRSAIELTTAPDHDTVEFGQFHVLEVLANDVLSGEPRQLSLVSEPYFGRAQVVGNRAIEYLHDGTDCAVDVFTYEVCQGDVCDSATVQVSVFCEDLLIYNGFSPNGDGVNDDFTILGLGRYPEHELQIFNREGTLLITFSDYRNDWRGEIGGQDVPEGTYFYVIDLGGGDQRSGYIQLSR